MPGVRMPVPEWQLSKTTQVCSLRAYAAQYCPDFIVAYYVGMIHRQDNFVQKICLVHWWLVQRLGTMPGKLKQSGRAEVVFQFSNKPVELCCYGDLCCIRPEW